jgi:hypothetical protein
MVLAAGARGRTFVHSFEGFNSASMINPLFTNSQPNGQVVSKQHG